MTDVIVRTIIHASASTSRLPLGRYMNSTRKYLNRKLLTRIFHFGKNLRQILVVYKNLFHFTHPLFLTLMMMINLRLLTRALAQPLAQQLSYSTTTTAAAAAVAGASCQGTLVKPINDKPIGYLTLPGLVKYDAALELQSYLVSRRHKITQNTLETSEPADMICFLEHPPTFTAGRRIRGKTEQEEEERLKKLGADYYETMRGGQITFHGPGQLIAYPILDVRDYQVSLFDPISLFPILTHTYIQTKAQCQMLCISIRKNHYRLLRKIRYSSQYYRKHRRLGGPG